MLLQIKLTLLYLPQFPFFFNSWGLSTVIKTYMTPAPLKKRCDDPVPPCNFPGFWPLEGTNFHILLKDIWQNKWNTLYVEY